MNRPLRLVAIILALAVVFTTYRFMTIRAPHSANLEQLPADSSQSVQRDLDPAIDDTVTLEHAGRTDARDRQNVTNGEVAVNDSVGRSGTAEADAPGQVATTRETHSPVSAGSNEVVSPQLDTPANQGASILRPSSVDDDPRNSIGPGSGENDSQAFGPGPGENEPQVFGPGPGENEPQVFGSDLGDIEPHVFTQGPGENAAQDFGPGPGENEPQVFGPGPGEDEPQVFGPGPSPN